MIIDRANSCGSIAGTVIKLLKLFILKLLTIYYNYVILNMLEGGKINVEKNIRIRRYRR